ncbi:hypothetical protein MMC20_006275 [Loxospora ochrophaea]|nr:hypothetical protein [Loxospora ochrophaea]
MFSTSYSKPHSIRKRMVSNIYSKSYLQNSSFLHIISQTLLFDRFLPLLESLAAAETPTDVLELNFAVTMDFIMAYLFGLPLGSNFIQDVGFRRHWLALYQNRMDRFPRQELPTLTSTLQAVGIRLVPKQTDEQTREIEALNLTTCTEAAKNPSTDPTVFSHLCSALNISTKNPADLLPVASETLDHLAAGHETSGITLTYLMHELSLHPALQDSLRAELLALSPPLKVNEGKPLPELPSPRSIDSLPLLHAILMETLRIHTAIPGGQPRITPAGVTTLGSFSNIPPDVRVSASGYTLHRNATVFPDPEAWKPERWLNASKEQKDEMLRWFWAFGSGGRMCVGSHFAIAEMKSIVGTIYTGFRTVVVDDEGMEQEDAYTASPKKRKLVLRFEKV